MSISDGQKANATNFNNAFASKTDNNTLLGEQDLANTNTASGSEVTNVQRELNSESSYTGKTLNSVKTDVPTYSSDAATGVVANENLTARAGALTSQMATNETNINSNTSNIALNTADISDIRTTTGTADTDIDMGVYTSATITDNQSTKQNIIDAAVQIDQNKSDITTLQNAPVFSLQGSYNAGTNTPTLINGTGTTGHAYKVSVAGSQDFGAGLITFIQGDLVFYDGSVWDKDKEQVSSVAGKSGAVTLLSADITDFSSNVSSNASVVANTAKISADGSIDTHSDVDTTTVAPTSGQALVWDGISKWNPGTVATSGGVAGLKNYIDTNDSNFETGISNWLTFDDVTAYIDGTGGVSANLTLSVSSVVGEFLEGTQSLKIAKGALDAQFEGLSVLTTTIDRQDYGRTLHGSMEIDFTDANYNLDDIVIKSYDASNNTILPVIHDPIGRVKGKVQFKILPTNTTASIRLSLMVNSTNATAYNLFVDDVKLGPDSNISVPIIKDFTNFTPTASWVSNITWTGKIARVGNVAKIHYHGILSNTSEATTLTINMPTGLTMDTASMVTSSAPFRLPGSFTTREAGVGEQLDCYPRYINSTTSFNLGIDIATSTYTQSGNVISSTVPFAWAAGDYVTGYIEVPIAEWSSGALVSTTETFNSTAKARYTTAAGQSIPNAVSTIIDFGTFDYDSHNAVTTGTAWKFTAPKSGKYRVSALILYVSTTTWIESESSKITLYKNGVAFSMLGRTNGNSGTDNQVTYGADTINLIAGDFIDIRAVQASGAALALQNSSQFNHISIEELPDFSSVGVYGETDRIEAFGALGLAPIVGTYANITSIVLEPGEYDICGFVEYRNTGVAGASNWAYCNISEFSAGITTDLVAGLNEALVYMATTSTNRKTAMVLPYKLIVNATKTYFLKGKVSGSATNVIVDYYRISARKVK